MKVKVLIVNDEMIKQAGYIFLMQKGYFRKQDLAIRKNNGPASTRPLFVMI